MSGKPPTWSSPRPSSAPAELARIEIRNLLGRAEQALVSGDFATAARFCQDVLKRQPDQPGALQMLGSMAQKTGANDVAISLFRRALSVDGKLVPAHLGLGDTYLATRQLDAAVTWYEKAGKLDRRNAEAQASLGTAYLAGGRREMAIEAFRRAVVIDRKHKLAAYMLAELTGRAGSQQVEYVRGVFDDYAKMFDEHLVKTLQYRTPQRIGDALLAAHPDRFAIALDLGCGTGLVAEALGPRRAGAIDGVDLSPKMVDVARRKGLYRELVVADLHEFVARPAVQSAGYDVVIAADVFVYVGRLERAFAAVAEILAPGQLFAFSVEHLEGDGYLLQSSGRHAHSNGYIAELAEASGFERLPPMLTPLRQENKTDIMGRIEVLRRTHAKAN